MKSLIILTIFDEVDEKTGRKTGEKLVSHGTDSESLEDVCLPQQRVESIGRFHSGLGEWVLK